MKIFKKINPEDLKQNPFELIGKDWMLIAAKNEGKTNAMTASWGALGVMWNKPVVFIVIRQTRYTKEFIDKNETFSLNFFVESFRHVLAYFGKVSGRDEDKIAKTKLTVSINNNTPIFEEAKLVFVCKKIFSQPYNEQSFIDKSIIEKFYNNDSLHTLYIGEIESILTK